MFKMKARRLCILFVCIAVLFSTVSVFALNNITLSTSYTTAAINSNGINKWVGVACYNVPGPSQRNDVIMYDKYGNVVWQENNAIMVLGQRQFWCGKNVTKFQVKVTYLNWWDAWRKTSGTFNTW